ncbi:hypothetical protein [Flavobacterium ginsenosidimutans]|uniref:Uncharacterized protein n=1 Tax=Flavobacterium ginsenosidimutans TaxID=687844 RepID=A0ABZ2QB40_9FLAO
MINKLEDNILFINPDNKSQSIVFNLKSWIHIIEAIIEKFALKTNDEAKDILFSSFLIKNFHVENYSNVFFYCNESEYHWAMLVSHGDQYWLKGISSDEPEDYFEWENQYRKKHNLAEESFVFSESHYK